MHWRTVKIFRSPRLSYYSSYILTPPKQQVPQIPAHSPPADRLRPTRRSDAYPPSRLKRIQSGHRQGQQRWEGHCLGPDCSNSALLVAEATSFTICEPTSDTHREDRVARLVVLRMTAQDNLACRTSPGSGIRGTCALQPKNVVRFCVTKSAEVAGILENL